MKNFLFVFAGVFIAIMVIIFTIRLFSGPEDTWICSGGAWVKHGNPSAPMPSGSCGGKTATPQTENPNIIVEEPRNNSIVGPTFILKGQARVFENQLNYKLTNQAGETITAGSITASADEMGEFGTFVQTINLPSNTPPKIVLQVFDYSAKDGSVTDLVEIDLNYIKAGK